MSPTVERTEFAGIYDRVHPAVAIVSTEAHCRLAAECSPATKVMTATCPVDGVLSVEQAWRGSAAWDGPSFDEDPKFQALAAALADFYKEHLKPMEFGLQK